MTVLCGASATGARALAPGARSAAPAAVLQASFSPKRLGQPTAISFTIAVDPASTPPPLAVIDFGYPAGLGFATSGLGLAACDPQRLAAEGASACPANAKVGAGSATAEVAFGPDIVQERVALELFAGPSPDGYLHLLILATGKEPIEAAIVMSGILLPGRLQITVPAVPGIPGGPDVSLSRVHATIGGSLTYYERLGGKTVAYHPRGVGLPTRCPSGGWQLAAGLEFADGAHTAARAVVTCPRGAGG